MLAGDWPPLGPLKLDIGGSGGPDKPREVTESVVVTGGGGGPAPAPLLGDKAP